MTMNRDFVHGLEVMWVAPEGSAAERPPVLFVHGTGCGAWIWENWLPLFAEHGYPTYALSLRGHAGSAGSYRGATLADYVDDIRRVVATFENAPVLAGQSMGARAIQLLVDDAPDTVRAAMLLAPVPLAGLPPRLAAVQMLRHPVCAIRAIVERDMEAMFRAPGLGRRAFFSPEVDDHTFDAFASRICGEPYLLFTKLGSRVRVRTPLPVPTLVGAAELDRLPMQMLRRDAETLGADFLAFDGVGHNFMVDARWHGAATTALAWLDGVTGRSPRSRLRLPD